MRIYVGNLPFRTTTEELRELFAEHGVVQDCVIPIDRDTGRSRGFGFVDMDEEEAQGAISALDGADLDGRQLRVNEARPRGGGGGGYRDDRRGGGGGGYRDDRGGGYREDRGSSRGGGGGGYRDDRREPRYTDRGGRDNYGGGRERRW